MNWACPAPPATELQRQTALSRQARPSKRRFHSVMSRSENVETPLHAARRRRPKSALLLLLGVVAFVVLSTVRLMTWHGVQAGPQIDNQLTGAFESALALGCLGWALLDRPRRGVAGALGAGLLAWVLGDLVWAPASSSSTPSAADGLSLLFYPLALLALILLAA